MKAIKGKNGHEITDIHERIDGYHGTLRHPDGRTEPVRGTWALGVPLSWYNHTHTTDTGFQAGDYIVVCGHWQI